mmetsp:Transcript_6400/g.10856  ORF Transcript_6400/g.10856 Transcript_6400/m.10856 type:complete len:132 (-) Transcript_6400:270-665(-)
MLNQEIIDSQPIMQINFSNNFVHQDQQEPLNLKSNSLPLRTGHSQHEEGQSFRNDQMQIETTLNPSHSHLGAFKMEDKSTPNRNQTSHHSFIPTSIINEKGNAERGIFLADREGSYQDLRADDPEDSGIDN